ncbi:MAG: TetR-like C-terminal domain-containing protein [Bacillota bacterium]|nr:TetR-like C-terminal domain-containing protein [Bacillota bacterium]
MKDQKIDRRVKYSLMVIKESFIKLLKQRPIAKITIKEICDDADVNRATFYAHYSDQYDLLHRIEQELIDGINQYLTGHDFNVISEEPVEMLKKIMEYVKENSELFGLLLNSNGDIQFQQEVIKIIGKQHFSSMTADQEVSEYMFLFFASGTIGIIQKWLKDGMKKPEREMAELILKLSINGRMSFE